MRAAGGGQGGEDVEDVEDDSARAAYVVVVDDVHAALESVRVPARSMTAAVDGLVRSLLSIPTAVVAGAHLDAGGARAAAPGGWLFALNAVADARLDVAANDATIAKLLAMVVTPS